MQSNTRRQPAPPIHTHEGARAARITPIQQLRRSVLSCLLWEDGFYESGVEIGQRIRDLVQKCHFPDVANLAIEARETMHLRHVPLLLVRELVRAGAPGVAGLLTRVIQRADEIPEFLAMYWEGKRTPIAKQVRIGLANAFRKFDAYALAKYNRDQKVVTLRDAMFLCHPKPLDAAQAAIWKQLADNTLPSPDTWEVALSAGADKRGTFERLLIEGKLGYLALLRNLRNMEQAGVRRELVERAILDRRGAHNVLPFRYIAAMRAAPSYVQQLDTALLASIEGAPVMPGRTVVLVDTSGSMSAALSSKSDLTRRDAAAALASVINGSVRTVWYTTEAKEIPTFRGLAGVMQLQRCPSGGTDLTAGLRVTDAMEYDRLIVITDEQTTHYRAPRPRVPNARHYMINVGVDRNGVGYGQPWIHLDGFSEQVIRWIAAIEGER